ncbi:MAG: redoxin domain-containing protein, partial [Chitinophagaceae bacterium]
FHLKMVVFIAVQFNIALGNAQEVKKIKIETLATYIKSSDHPIIISFWATWCTPCIHEIPWLLEAVDKQKDKKVEYILVSLDFKEAYPEKINSFAQKNKFNATLFWLDETNADYFCPMIDEKWSGGIPANLFVNNKTGLRKFIGRQLTERQVTVEMELLLKE